MWIRIRLETREQGEKGDHLAGVPNPVRRPECTELGVTCRMDTRHVPFDLSCCRGMSHGMLETGRPLVLARFEEKLFFSFRAPIGALRLLCVAVRRNGFCGNTDNFSHTQY